MNDLDPNAPADPASGLYGLDSDPETARFHVFGVPFDATTSYRTGAARGPRAMRIASHQVELLDLELGRPYEAGIAWLGELDGVEAWNDEASEAARRARDGDGDERVAQIERVDRLGAEVERAVEAATRRILELGKIPVVLGGDHSVPLGAWRAAADWHGALGLLHFDAHADLREAYEGFASSHASVMNGALRRLDSLERVVQVGIRDVCDEELALIAASEGRVQPLFDFEWSRAVFGGLDLRALVRERLAALPETVWVTFDIDGLDPTLCPNTGTPVPGGLDWRGVSLWLSELARSGKRVAGIDLVEVAPGMDRPLGQGWDEIVGARLLYRLIGAAASSSLPSR